MPKDPQITEIQQQLDDLVEAVEAYREHLLNERMQGEAEQPENAVYLRRLGTTIGYVEQMLEQLDGDVRDLLVQAADISFTKNQSRDPNFV